MPRKKRPSELLAPGEYEILLARQGGVCAICKNPPRTRRLDIDHNHTTGETRGLLCARCNAALPSERRVGALGPWLFRALEYVGARETP